MSERQVLKQWIRQLKEGDEHQRAEAAEELGMLDIERPMRVRALLAALDDDVPEVRAAAAFALHGFQDPVREAIPKLLPMLKHPEYGVRQAAVFTLEEIDPTTPEIVAGLIGMIDDPHLSYDAMRAVGQLRPSTMAAAGVGRLIEALRQPPRAEAAAEALGHIGPDAAKCVPELLRCLGGTDPRVTQAAVEALGKIGPAARAAVPELLDLLDNGVAMARAKAAEEKFEAEMPSTIRSHLKGMSAKIGPSGLRVSAALALWRIEQHDRAIHLLTAALNDPAREVRRKALEAIYEIGPDAGRAVTAVAQLACSDNDASNRALAIDVLPGMGAAALLAEHALLEALSDRRKRVRWLAARALGHLKYVGEPAVEALRSQMNGRGRQRLAAAAALWEIDLDPAAIEVLVEALGSDRSSLRCRSAWLLREIGPPARSALAALDALLADDDERVARAAARAIEQIRGASPWN